MRFGLAYPEAMSSYVRRVAQRLLPFFGVAASALVFAVG
jgi:hypothetical protein